MRDRRARRQRRTSEELFLTSRGPQHGIRKRCGLHESVRRALREPPSIIYTYYDLKNYRGFEGNTPAAKFPAPVKADDAVKFSLVWVWPER